MPISLAPLADAEPLAVERLLDAAFGTDRHQRTAYRLRAGMDWIPALSFAALEQGQLVGALQCWPVALHGHRQVTPLVLVGPVAVDPRRQRAGIGRAMMDAMLDQAEGGDPLVLIGDPEYYGRLFGFTADPTSGWELPGPFERRRLLARVDGHDLPRTGALGPRQSADAA